MNLRNDSTFLFVPRGIVPVSSCAKGHVVFFAVVVQRNLVFLVRVRRFRETYELHLSAPMNLDAEFFRNLLCAFMRSFLGGRFLITMTLGKNL